MPPVEVPADDAPHLPRDSVETTTCSCRELSAENSDCRVGGPTHYISAPYLLASSRGVIDSECLKASVQGSTHIQCEPSGQAPSPCPPVGESLREAVRPRWAKSE